MSVLWTEARTRAVASLNVEGKRERERERERERRGEEGRGEKKENQRQPFTARAALAGDDGRGRDFGTPAGGLKRALQTDRPNL